MSDEIYATLVEINQEPTPLYKILKFENLVSGGGEAKFAISEGYVLLNGEVETQKRKKIYAGDLITFNGEHYQIALKGELDSFELIEKEPLVEIDEADLTLAEELKNRSEDQVIAPVETIKATTADIKEESITSTSVEKKRSGRKPISF